MKTLMIKEAVFIYRWYDKDTERYHRVMFDGKGNFAGGYSNTKDEDDPNAFSETCAEIPWEDGVLMVEKSLVEDEKEAMKETMAIPEKCFDIEN